LQEGEFERVGGTQTLKVDVRIIAATNRDLRLAVKEGRFRSDLYYRLNVFPIEMPALRDRREDVPLLVWHFVEKLAANSGKTFDAIPRPLMDALSDYDWPGNIRELRNVVERAIVLSPGPVLRVDEAFGTGTLQMRSAPGSETHSPDANRGGSSASLKTAERAHITRVLEDRGWKVRGDGGAAEALGLKESSLRYRMKKLGIKRPS
jgi:transcriptional regulator with GAF, ATPase, and Fis domain